MSETLLTDESFGNGVKVKITSPEIQWIDTDERPSYHGWPTVANMGNDRLALVYNCRLSRCQNHRSTGKAPAVL